MDILARFMHCYWLAVFKLRRPPHSGVMAFIRLLTNPWSVLLTRPSFVICKHDFVTFRDIKYSKATSSKQRRMLFTRLSAYVQFFSPGPALMIKPHQPDPPCTTPTLRGVSWHCIFRVLIVGGDQTAQIKTFHHGTPWL